MQKYINAWCEMVAILRDFITTPKIKNAFLWGFALYAIALFALIRGDIYYIDDLQTSIVDSNWNHFSRYLGTFILNDLMTFGKGAVDLSPLLQILAVILAIISSLILIYLIRKKFDLIGIVASLPLGLSPHFLQNLSYKFESLFMCVALFCAILPFLFKENRRIFSAVSIISLILMFMTYQAANGTYIILSLYFAFSLYFLEGRSFKESAIFLAICAMNLIVATLIYRFAIAMPVSEFIIAYTSDKAFPLDNLLLGIWANLITYLTTIFNDFKNTPYIWLVALIALLFVINIAIRTNRPKFIAICGAILFLVFGICLSYGLYLVLEMTIFEPRVFYGFNAFVAIISIANSSRSDFLGSASSRSLQRTPSASHSLVSHNAKNSSAILEFAPSVESVKSNILKILHYASATIAVITAYFLISFANIYGNALKKQDEYLDFRAQLLLKDLGDKVPKDSMVNLKIYLGYSAVTKRFAEKYGGISRLVPKVAENDWFFHWRLQHFNARYNDSQEELCDHIKQNFNSELIVKNAYHTIERVKSCYFVTIK